jgi:FkbM family methyltransferase
MFVSILHKTEALIGKVKKSLQRKTDDQFRQLEKWYADDPHHLKRHHFPHLTEHSTVFDLGGYEGQWSSDIYARYNCKVHVFEPVAAYASMIQQRFAKNKSIAVYAFGLADTDAESTIIIDKFASRITSDSGSGDTEKIRLKEFRSFLAEKQLTQIDLIKINIEGAEYPLLNYLIDTGCIKQIDHLLIQFHNFIPNAGEKRNQIRKRFSETHELVFDYPFVWECWKKKQ